MENDRDTSLQSWESLTLFLPRRWPRLTNLNPDPAFAGRGSLSVMEGATVIGSSPDAGVAQVVGTGVRHRHAVVCSSASNDVVVLCALPGAETHVNGKLVVADGERDDDPDADDAPNVAVATVPDGAAKGRFNVTSTLHI